MRLIQKHQQANGKGTGVIKGTKQYAVNVRNQLWDYYGQNWIYDYDTSKWITPEEYVLPEGDQYRKKWDELYGPMYNKLDSVRQVAQTFASEHYDKDPEPSPLVDEVAAQATELGGLLIPNDTVFGRTFPDMSDPKIKEHLTNLQNRINQLNVSNIDRALRKMDLNKNTFSYKDVFNLARAAGISASDILLAYQLAKEGNAQFRNGISF